MAQLAGLIRSKYPGEYDDLDDDELEQKVVSKYPEYKDLVTPKEAPKALKVENPEVDRIISEAKKVSGIPEIEKSISSEIEKPSLLKRFSDTVSGFAEEHPKIKSFAEKLISGSEPHKYTREDVESINKRLRGKDIFGTPYKQVQEGEEQQALGPGLMEIPGIGKATDWLSQKITGSEGTGRLIAGAITKALGDIFATGLDPRSVGAQRAIHDPNVIDVPFRSEDIPPSPRGELPPIRRSQEIPYRANEPSGVEDLNVPTSDLPIRRAQTVPPEMVPVGSEDIFNFNRPTEPPISGMSEEDLFRNAVEKFNMGRELPAEMGTPIREPIRDLEPTRYPAEEAIDLGELAGSTAEQEVTRELEPRKPSFANPFEPANVTEEPQFSKVLDFPVEPPERFLGKTAERDIYGEEQPKQSTEFADEFNKQLKSKEEFAQSIREASGEPIDIFEPQAARTESGKIAIGADVKSLGKVLGTSLYKGDIAPIATKELLQNSIDAVRHLGSEGKIDVIFDRVDNTIHVTDNGKGLTRKELETVFTDLGASGKREDVEAAGGFGLAKAAPLLGGEKVEVVSIAKDPKSGQIIESSFSGTPDELLEGVDIKQRVIVPDDSTKIQTGTSVKVKIPQDSDFYEARQFVENLSKHSHGLAANIRTGTRHSSEVKNIEEILTTSKRGTGTSLVKLNNPSARTELILPEGTKSGTQSHISLHLSNNGMFQRTKIMYLQGEVPGVPSDIIVDIRPKVPEGHSDYPFTANREELRGTVQKQVQQYIQDNVVTPSVGKRIDELKRLYNGMLEINVGGGEFPYTFGRKIAIYDPKGQITPDEMKQITTNPAFLTLAKTIAETLDEAMNVAGTNVWKNRLEKIGIIFSEKLHGVHIPNPKTEWSSYKSAILINPFNSINKMSSDEASANILHTILHELAHVDPSGRMGHNEDFTIRLGDIYAKFGARRSVEAQDNILKSIADPNTGIYNSEIQEVLSIYEDSRGRTETTEDLLSGTGIGSGSDIGGKGAIPKRGKPTRKRATPSEAVEKLLNAIGEARILNEEQASLYKQERARRFAAFEGVKTEGAAGAGKSLGKLKGEYEKVDFSGLEGVMSEEEIDTLFTAVKGANITTGEKARGYTGLFKILNGEGVPQNNELRILNDVFGGGFGERVIEMHGGIGAVGIKLGKVANTMKSLRSSLDLSAPLRQGIGLIHRPEWRESFANMFKFMANKEAFNTVMSTIEHDPYYLVSRDAGLFIAKPNDLIKGEEAFLNSYIPEIGRLLPPVRWIVEASERAYVGFLNELRFKTFKNLVNNARDAGNEVFTLAEDAEGGKSIVPTKATKDLAKYINVSTGRGGLGQLEKVSKSLNTVIWSPRLLSSRLSMLNPKYYRSLDKFAKIEAIKSLFAIAAVGLTTLGLAKLMGGKGSYNILSTDFGKSRFNENVVDPWAGFQQIVVATARFIAGEANSKPQSRTQTLENFTANKLSPMAALAYEIGSARKFTEKGGYISRYGQPKNITPEIANSFAPMFVQDVIDIFESDSSFAEQVGLNTISLFGMGVQNYPEPTVKSKNKFKFRKMSLNP